MLKILQLIGGFFTAGGPISAFFTRLGVKLASKGFIVGIQIGRIAALVVAYVSFLVAVLKFSIKTINYINSFLGDMQSRFFSDDLLSIAFRVLQSLGITDAFNDAFAIFNILFPALIGAWALKFSYRIYKLVSDEFYKLGSLIQA